MTLRIGTSGGSSPARTGQSQSLGVAGFQPVSHPVPDVLADSLAIVRLAHSMWAATFAPVAMASDVLCHGGCLAGWYLAGKGILMA